MSSDAVINRLQGFAIGAISASICYLVLSSRRQEGGNKGAGSSNINDSNNNNNNNDNGCNGIGDSDDNCNSLFYDNTLLTDGHGFSNTKSIDQEVVSKLTTIHKDYCRLPIEFYRSAVECLPILCVDAVCMRKSDRKILLFYRRDKPAAKIWWLPGGRMFKGETFFATAVRKVRDETGNKEAKVKSVGIINTWNTFFPDSNWDEGRAVGREGTQTVNIAVFCELDDDNFSNNNDIKVPNSAASPPISTNNEWAVEEQKWVTVEEALQDGVFDKYIRLNVHRAKQLRYF